MIKILQFSVLCFVLCFSIVVNHETTNAVTQDSMKNTEIYTYVQPLNEWRENPKYAINQSIMNMMAKLQNNK